MPKNKHLTPKEKAAMLLIGREQIENGDWVDKDIIDQAIVWFDSLPSNKDTEWVTFMKELTSEALREYWEA